jgi:hypothetical protein
MTEPDDNHRLQLEISHPHLAEFSRFLPEVPVSREFAPQTGSRATGSSASESGLWGVIFPVGENPDIPAG